MITKEGADYLAGFSQQATLKGTWAKSAEVKECYKWCEQHLGAKYKDWFLMGSTLYFKDDKRATFFRLTWGDIIA